jgi:hypothetical protein
VSFRLTPNDITPITQSPFMTVFAARCTAPLSEVISSAEAFLSVRNNLRAGDRVQLARFEHGEWTKARVLEFGEVIITQSSAAGVEHMLSFPIVEVDAARAAPQPPADADKPVLRLEAEERGGWNVLDEAGSAKHFNTKKAAQDYIRDYGRPAEQSNAA